MFVLRLARVGCTPRPSPAPLRSALLFSLIDMHHALLRASTCVVLSTLGAAQTNTSWQYVGTPGFSEGVAICERIAVDSLGLAHVAYQDLSIPTARATARRFENGAWNVLVAKGTASVGQAYYCTLAFDAANNLYVASRDYGLNSRMNLRRFDRASSTWSTVGTSGPSNGEAHYTFVAVGPDGAPNVAYADNAASDRASFQRYVGGAWTSLGAAGFTQAGASFESTAVAQDGTIYVAYCDGSHVDASNVSKATVMRWDPGASTWSAVGEPGFSAQGAPNLILALDHFDTPWVAYYRYHQGIVVMRFNGTTWETIGGSATGADQPTVDTEEWRQWLSLAFDSTNAPYIAYQMYTNGRRATVRRFDGTAWNVVGTKGFTPSSADYLSMVVDAQDIPWVTFRDGAYFGRASVMKLAPTATTYCSAVTSSLGCVPEISCIGVPSASGASSFHVHATNIISHRPGLLIYGAQPASTPFQGGVLCIASPVRRGGSVSSGGTSATPDCTGEFDYDFGALLASGATGLAVGTTGCAQFWYRDAQNPLGPGLSNAVRFVVGP